MTGLQDDDILNYLIKKRMIEDKKYRKMMDDHERVLTRSDKLMQISSFFKHHKLINENCAICNDGQNIQRHHPNYDLPYHVYFLCKRCHLMIHKLDNLKIMLG